MNHQQHTGIPGIHAGEDVKQAMDVLVSNFAAVGHALLNAPLHGHGHVRSAISIADPGDLSPDALARLDPDAVLRLEFEDLDITDTQAARLVGNIGEPFHLVTPAQIASIIRFARCDVTASSTMVVHCHAGVSRSTAAAVLVHAARGRSGAESLARARGGQRASFAWGRPRTFRPNVRMLALGSRQIFDDLRLVEVWAETLRIEQRYAGPACERWLAGER